MCSALEVALFKFDLCSILFICGFDFSTENLNSWKHTPHYCVFFFIQIFLSLRCAKEMFLFCCQIVFNQEQQETKFPLFAFFMYMVNLCSLCLCVHCLGRKTGQLFFHYLLHRDWIQISFSSSYITLILYKNICIVLVFCVIWLFFYAFFTFSRICVNYIKRTGNFFVS